MSSSLRNIRLLLAYDGTDFSGWQRQPAAPTVQATVETALEQLLGEPATVYASGRTDAGVHAANQVANFKTHSPIPCENLRKALNRLLPPSIIVKDARPVSDSFHARYQARAKSYRYRLLMTPVASPFIARYAYHWPYPLDWRSMAQAARLLEGRHDFTSFAGAPRPADDRSRGGEEESMQRTIFHSRLAWRARPRILLYEVRANGFLYHMVRNIVGTLIEIGRHRVAPGEMERILESRDRAQAGPTAPARGLCLWKVEYD